MSESGLMQGVSVKPVALRGGCHCRAVRFVVTVRSADPEAIVCDCSICTQKGFVHLIVPATDFELVSGEGALTEYRFGTRTARHLFCRVCGIHSFYRPRSHPDVHSVNVRCLDDGDRAVAEGFRRVGFHGRDWDAHIDEIAGHDR